MTRKAAKPDPGYPPVPVVKRAVKAARDAGVKVSSISISRDGTITLSEAMAEPAKSDIDTWFRDNEAR